MSNKNYALIALGLIRMRTPNQFWRKSVECFGDYDPEKVIISPKLAEACVTLSVDPETFLDLPSRVQQAIRLYAKRGRVNRAAIKAKRVMDFYRLWLANDGKCYISNKPLEFDKATRDHVFPKARGFLLSYNYMPASPECNRTKGDNWPTLGQIYRAYRAYRRLGKWFNPTTRKNDPIKFRFKFTIKFDLNDG